MGKQDIIPESTLSPTPSPAAVRERRMAITSSSQIDLASGQVGPVVSGASTRTVILPRQRTKPLSEYTTDDYVAAANDSRRRGVLFQGRAFVEQMFGAVDQCTMTRVMLALQKQRQSLAQGTPGDVERARIDAILSEAEALFQWTRKVYRAMAEIANSTANRLTLAAAYEPALLNLAQLRSIFPAKDALAVFVDYDTYTGKN